MIELLIEDQVLLLVWAILIFGILALIPVFIIVSRVFPYAYPNARIRAMRKNLAKSQLLADLAPRSYNDIIIQLEEIYPNLAKQYASDLSFANLDSALRQHLINRLEKIKRIVPQESKAFVKALVAKYDIQVIETVVRSIAQQGSITTDVLNKTELFSQDFISRETHSLADLRNELKQTPYETLINKYYSELENNELKSFEQELDLLYFARLKSTANTPEATGYVKRLIDAHNIALINQEEEALIPGGRIPQYELSTSMTTQQLSEIARKHKYHITEHNDKQLLERDMQRNIKRYAKTLLQKEPLSPASIIGFIALQTISVRNTVILLKMKYHDMSPDRIREVLAL